MRLFTIIINDPNHKISGTVTDCLNGNTYKNKTKKGNNYKKEPSKKMDNKHAWFYEQFGETIFGEKNHDKLTSNDLESESDPKKFAVKKNTTDSVKFEGHHKPHS